MSRSLYKIPFVHKSVFKKCLNSKMKKKIKISEQKKIKKYSSLFIFLKKKSFN